MKQRVERFLFAPADAASVAIFRIVLALALAANFRVVGDATRAIESHALIRILFGTIFMTRPYHWMCLLMIALLAVGIRARLVGFILVAMLAPLDFLAIGRQSRQMLIFALFVFSFLRSDLRLAPWRAQANGDVAGPMWPMRLIQIQLSLVYGVNALAKSTPAYLSGNVLVGFARMLPNFSGTIVDGVLHLGPVALPVMVAAILSAAAEYVLAIGLWIRRLRWPVAIFGLAFHLMLQSILHIYMLDWTSIAMYPAFLLPLDRVNRTRH